MIRLAAMLRKGKVTMKKKPEAMILTTTLRLLRNARNARNAHACTPRYTFLRDALGPKYDDDKPINLLAILKTNGLDDALWALRATAQNCDTAARLMAADFAERVLPIWKKMYPKDDRPAKAIKATRDFARGNITCQEWAAEAAGAARAAWAAAWAADAAAWAAGAAAGAAAAEAAAGAAEAAGAAAEAAEAAAGAAEAAGAAAEAEKNRQQAIFVSYLLESESAD